MNYTEAEKLERDGAYEAAAMEFAKCGFEKLLKSNFRPCRTFRIGLAHLLQAISCDARSGNDTRAKGLCEVTISLYKLAKEDDPSKVLSGLYNEWIADGLLMIGDPNALSYYELARESYRSLDESDRSWWMEEEYHYAKWAFEGFITHHSYDYPEDNSLEWKFCERTHFKSEIGRELMNILTDDG